jgi:hypothetical protein
MVREGEARKVNGISLVESRRAEQGWLISSESFSVC